MKQLIVILTLFSFQSSLLSQKWFDTTDTWVYRMNEGFSAIEGYCEYTNARDTLVNGLNAKAIDGYHKYYSWQFGNTTDYTSVQLFYEENDRIYSFNDLDSLYLLYDFNLQVGDSISYARPFSCDSDGSIDTLVMHLDSVSSILFNNETLEVQYFSFYDQLYQFSGNIEVVETLGAINANFNLNEILLCQSFHPFNESLCSFSIDAEEIKFLEEDCYFVITNVIDPKVTQFNIFPNPVADVLFIETEHQTFSVKIYDSTGTLLQTHLNDKAVQLGSLPQGIYFLELIADGRSDFSRVIKS